MASSLEWGDEVMRGITMIRRSQPHPLVAQAIAGGRGAIDATPQDLALLHESIDEATVLIQRLRSSNEQLREYLRSQAATIRNDADDDDCSMAAMSSVAASSPADVSDPEIEDAIRENESIIKQKEQELAELRQLLSFARCGREVRGVSVPGLSVESAQPADDPAPTSMEL